MDDNREFVSHIEGQWGMAEKALGQEMYGEQIDQCKAQSAILRERGKQIKQVTSVLVTVDILLLTASIPVVVWLWRWAVG